MRAVFLDRDGVLNENRPDYVKTWREFRWLPGAREALAALAGQPCRIIVVTNQSIVGRGLVSAETLAGIHARMRWEAQEFGGRIDAVYACPHAPEAACRCRKPAPGMLQRAAAEHGIDLPASVMVGDAFSDYLAAHSAGLAYVHVRTGRGAAQLPLLPTAAPGLRIADDLRAALPLLMPAPVGAAVGALA